MEKWVATAPSGAEVNILATDPMAKIDIPLFCRQQGHAVAVESEPDGATRFLITKSLGDRD